MMKIYPAVSSKSFSNCEPGELVQMPFADAVCWAFVAKDADRNFDFALILGATNGQMTPSLHMGGPGTVMSFGCDYHLQLNLDAKVEFRANQLWEKLGVVCLSGDDVTMFIAQPPHLPYGHPAAVSYDFDEGQVSDNPDASGVILCGGWSLHLGEKRREGVVSPPILEFSI